MSQMLKRLGWGFVAFAVCALVAPVMGLAADAAAAGSVAADNESTVKVFLALAAGFGIAIAAFGGALAQGRAAAAALEGIARNPGAAPRLMAPMILGLALIESLVIYVLIIAFVLSNKI